MSPTHPTTPRSSRPARIELLERVQGYLNKAYDVAAIFSARGKRQTRAHPHVCNRHHTLPPLHHSQSLQDVRHPQGPIRESNGVAQDGRSGRHHNRRGSSPTTRGCAAKRSLYHRQRPTKTYTTIDMARPVDEIKREMTDASWLIQSSARSTSSRRGDTFRSAFSLVSLENILFFIVAAAHHVVERIFDGHREDVERTLERAIVATVPCTITRLWLTNMATSSPLTRRRCSTTMTR